MSRRHERASDPRAAGRLARVLDAGTENRVRIERDAGGRQPGHDLADAIGAVRPLLRQKYLQALGVDVHEISEDVHVRAGDHRGDLDPGDELDAGLGARRPDGRAGGDGVVVGHREHGDAGRGRAGHEFRRRAAAVRRGRVRVEVDHLAERAAAPRFPPRAR